MAVSMGGTRQRHTRWRVAELIRWTKGFGAPNIEGHDVAAMFKDSLKRLVSGSALATSVLATGKDIAWQFRTSGPFRWPSKNVPAELTALINDTTGTLIASNYVDPHTKIAVIFGTGCNAAYMETAENIPKMSSVGLPDGQGMAINVGLARRDTLPRG
jgi:hexokinase